MNNHSIEETLVHIGNELYYQRHLKKEKITFVSNEVGVSNAVISRIENGRYGSLTVALLSKLAAHYKVPLASLFIRGSDETASGEIIEYLKSEITFLRENYLQLLEMKGDKTSMKDI